MRRRSTRSAAENGSSMIESLVALLLLAISLVYVFGAMSSFSLTNRRNQARANAAAAARTRTEELRFLDPATLPSSGSQTATTTVGQHRFTVVTQYCSTSTYCDDRTRHVLVTIQEDGRQVFETETVLTQLR